MIFIKNDFVGNSFGADNDAIGAADVYADAHDTDDNADCADVYAVIGAFDDSYKLYDDVTKIELQANAVEGIDSCKERTKCGGAKDKEEAQRQLAVKTNLMIMMIFVVIMIIFLVMMVKIILLILMMNIFLVMITHQTVQPPGSDPVERRTQQEGDGQCNGFSRRRQCKQKSSLYSTVYSQIDQI